MFNDIRPVSCGSRKLVEAVTETCPKQRFMPQTRKTGGATILPGRSWDRNSVKHSSLGSPFFTLVATVPIVKAQPVSRSVKQVSNRLPLGQSTEALASRHHSHSTDRTSGASSSKLLI